MKARRVVIQLEIETDATLEELGSRETWRAVLENVRGEHEPLGEVVQVSRPNVIRGARTDKVRRPTRPD